MCLRQTLYGLSSARYAPGATALAAAMLDQDIIVSPELTFRYCSRKESMTGQ
jgi:hypothetical protein